MVERCIPRRETIPRDPLVIVTEQVDGVRIGRTTLRVEPFFNFFSTKAFDTLLNSLNGPRHSNEDLRRGIVFSLTNNVSSSKNPIAHERPVSAYFTYNPNEETVIIEWGTIDPSSKDAKLHNFLNQNIDFQNRDKQGMRISSGHLAKLTGREGYLALFDNLLYRKPKSEIVPSLKKTINTLYQHNITPITADGFVQLPVF